MQSHAGEGKVEFHMAGLTGAGGTAGAPIATSWLESHAFSSHPNIHVLSPGHGITLKGGDSVMEDETVSNFL